MSEALEQLKQFRSIHVEERRRQVRDALEMRAHNGDGGLFGNVVSALQEQIEAIDRAIADEERLNPA